MLLKTTHYLFRLTLETTPAYSKSREIEGRLKTLDALLDLLLLVHTEDHEATSVTSEAEYCFFGVAPWDALLAALSYLASTRKLS